MQDKNNLIKNNRYALRKFKSAGLASALIGVSTISFLITNSKPVKASINNDPNEESNNDALKKEQEQDLQSGEKHETIERIHQSKTQVTKLPQHKKQEENRQETQTKKQEENKQETQTKKQEENKQETQTKKQEKNRQETQTKKQDDTKNTTNASSNKVNIPKAKKDTKDALKDLEETNAKLHENLNNLDTNKDKKLLDKSSDNTKATAPKKPTKLALNSMFFALPQEKKTTITPDMLETSLVAKTNNKPQWFHTQSIDNSNTSLKLKGYHKTGAGWTTLNNVETAKESNVIVMDSNLDAEMPTETNEYIGGYQDYGVRINGVIKQSDLKRGNKILIASIPILVNDKNHAGIYNSGDSNTRNNTLYANNIYIGHINVETHRVNNNDDWERDYYLTVDTDAKYATDLSFKYDASGTFHTDWSFGGYQNWRNIDTIHPFKYKLVMPDNSKTYTWSFTKDPNRNVYFYHQNESENTNNLYVDGYWHYIDGAGWNWNTTDDTSKPRPFKQVLKIHSIDNSKITDPGSLFSPTHITWINDKNEISNDSIRWDTWGTPATKLANGLSSQEVLDQTPLHSFTFSRQNDSTILVGINIDNTEWNYNESGVENQFNGSYFANIILTNDQDRDKYRNYTVNYYKKRNWQPIIRNNLQFYMANTDNEHPHTIEASDITPDTNKHANNAMGSYSPNNSKANTAYYRTIPVNYIDDDNNGQTIGTDTVIGITNKDLIVNPTMDLNLPSKYVLTNYAPFDYGIVQDKDNHTINIHVRHKIIGTVNNLHENAHNLRDYLIDQVKNDDNVQIIHDQDQTYNPNAEDQNSMNKAFDDVNQDYTKQTNTIAEQVKEYLTKKKDFEQKRQQFIDKLKAENLWSDDMTDPKDFKQNLQIGNETEATVTSEVLKPNAGFVNDNGWHEGLHGYQFTSANNADLSGDFFKLTYSNLKHSTYNGQAISKITVTYHDAKDGGYGVFYENNPIYGWNPNGNAAARIEFYDANGNKIHMHSAYLTVGSFNTWTDATYHEAAQLLSGGTPIQIPESSVSNHPGNLIYADKDNSSSVLFYYHTPNWNKDPNKVAQDQAYADSHYPQVWSKDIEERYQGWDSGPDAPNRIFGAIAIKLDEGSTGIDIRPVSYNSQTHHIGRIGNWFNWSTTIPPMSFDAQQPKLEIHYHNDKINPTTTRDYKVIAQMPSEKYGPDQTLLEWHPHFTRDQARDMVTNQKQDSDVIGLDNYPVNNDQNETSKYVHGTYNIHEGYWRDDQGNVLYNNDSSEAYVRGKYFNFKDVIPGYKLNDLSTNASDGLCFIQSQPNSSYKQFLFANRFSTIDPDNHGNFAFYLSRLATNGSNTWYNPLTTPDSFTKYITFSPVTQQTHVIFVDDDNNEQQVGAQDIYGKTDQTTKHIHLTNYDHDKYVVDDSPSNFIQITLPSNIVGASDNRTIVCPVYNRTGNEYMDYTFSNVYSNNTNTWSNATDYTNTHPIYIHLHEKQIGTDQPGNIINPVHDLKADNVDPNITWIQDPTIITTVNDDDQGAIDQALTNIANDYNNQERNIRHQLQDYYNRLDQFNQSRQDYINQLKQQGLWTDSTVDPASIKQSLHLNSEPTAQMHYRILDPNSIQKANDNTFTFLKNNIPNDYLEVTYNNLQNSSYRNHNISKIVLTLSNMTGVNPNRHTGQLTISGQPIGGLNYDGMGTDINYHFYDENGNLINFGDDAYLTVGSLNGRGHDATNTEKIQLLSNGNVLKIPESAVSNHPGNIAYMDNPDESSSTKYAGWDNATGWNRIYGAAIFKITGSNIKVRSSQGNGGNTYNANNYMWYNYSTTIPPMTYDKQAPKLTIHYHENRLKTDFNRHYTINYVYPNDVQDYYDNYNNIGYVHANRYAGRNLVTNQDSYSNYNIDKSLNLNMNSSKALDLNWQQIYGYNIKSDIPDQNILNNHTSVAYTKDHQAFNGNVKNLADDFNYNVYYTPGQVQGKVKFVDEDTGELVQTNDVYGYLDQSVDISYIPIPRGYQIAPDSEKPDKFTFHPSDNMHPDQSITIYVVQATRAVQDTPRTIHVIVNNHPDLNSDITFTRKGEYNEHTGQTKWQDWLVDQAHGTLEETNDSYDLDGSSVTDLDQYNLNYKITLNNNQIKSGTLNADNSDLSLSINPNDSHFNNATNDLTYVIDLNQTPAIKQQYIIYEDSETHRELGNDSIIGPIGSSQRFTLQHFDGYKDPTNIPSTLTIKSDDTPYVIYLDKLAIFVPHNNPVKNGDHISNYTNEYTGDDTFPDGLDKNDLNHPVREIVNITKNGETHTTIHTLYFSRDAYYYPANGEIRYTDWQSEQTFDSVPLDHNGVTPIVVGGKLDANNNIAPVTVNANSQDVVIDVSYEKDDKGITLVWDDINMSNREIKRINMSLEDFKNNSHPEKTVLPDFRYIDEAHPETVNNYVNDITYTLSDSDGNVLSSGNVKDLNKAKALLHEKNHGYLLVFSNQHAYQTLHANANDQDDLPPFKSTYRTVHVHLPNGLTYKFRFGIRWKLSDRNQDLVTGLKKALNTDILYEPVSYSGITDPEYPEITKESVISMLANYGLSLTNLKLDNYDMQISGDGSGKAITASSPNQDVNVTFLGHHVQTKVELVDISSGKIVAFNYVSGRIGQTINIPYPDLPSGYVNAGLAHYPKTYTFTSNTPEPVIVRVAKVKGNDHNSIPIDPDLNMSGKGMTSITKPKEHAVSMFTSSFMAIPSSPKFDDVKLAMPNLQSHITQTKLNSKQRAKRIMQKAPVIKAAASHVTSAPQIKRNTTPDTVKSQNTKPIISQASNANFVPTNNKPITKQMAHDQALNAQLFTSDTNKPQLNKSNQDLLNKLSNLNTKPTYNSLSADNQVQIASKHELANKLNTLSKVKPVTHKVNAATNVTNNKENTKAKTDNSQDKTKSNKALVASLLGLTAGTSAAGVSLYKKKYKHLPNSNDTFNK